jgi:ABC-type nitrate/sulfonate/bicarbonate transport system substrate-binding protein
VPLSDCAPLVVAQELGLFDKYEVRVRLSREIGWATVRDKICYGELDAAHALGPMVFAAGLGLESPQIDCLTGVVLNRHGNAITLSKPLWESARQCGVSLRGFLRDRREKLVVGIPFLYSSHHFLVRSWLRLQGLSPDQVAHFVVVPPPQMPSNLKAGHLAAYCVGEPWNSAAVLARSGVVAATSAEIAPLHPEKVLMVRRKFAETRGEEHVRLIAALLEACSFCDAPQNKPQILELLSRREYVNAPIEALRPSMAGYLGGFHGTEEPRDDFTIFARDDTNEPSEKKASWILQGMRTSGLSGNSAAQDLALAKRMFRTDIFEQALRLRNSANSVPEKRHEPELENQPALP